MKTGEIIEFLRRIEDNENDERFTALKTKFTIVRLKQTGLLDEVIKVFQELEQVESS